MSLTAPCQEPDPELLGALALTPAAVPMSHCPPTYSSMVRTVDKAGRPVGPQAPPEYIDPYRVSVSPAVSMVRNLVAVRLDAAQGTRFWVLYCEAVPELPVHAS